MDRFFIRCHSVVLTFKGMDYTAENLAGRMTTLTLIHDREHDEENLDGPEALQGLFFDCIVALGIDPDKIINYEVPNLRERHQGGICDIGRSRNVRLGRRILLRPQHLIGKGRL